MNRDWRRYRPPDLSLGMPPGLEYRVDGSVIVWRLGDDLYSVPLNRYDDQRIDRDVHAWAWNLYTQKIAGEIVAQVLHRVLGEGAPR